MATRRSQARDRKVRRRSNLNILDSSAVLAVALREPGSDLAGAAFEDAAISTVNVAEVYTKASQLDLSRIIIDAIFAIKGLEIVPLSMEQAQRAGGIVSITQSAGLSLGDRCCLALGIERQCPIFTSDRAWAQFAEPLGIDIRVIR